MQPKTAGVWLAALVLCGWLLYRFIQLFNQLRDYIQRVSECGHIEPPPTPMARRLFRWFVAVWKFYQIGRVEVTGRENLKVEGPLLVIVNHTHYLDTASLFLELDNDRRPMRYLAAQRLYQFLLGIPALIAAPLGFIPVNLAKGKGGPAREAAVNVLSSEQPQMLIIHPEGFAYLDGSRGPFKPGAARIAKEAERRHGKPINILQIVLKYNRYPGDWIRKLDSPLAYLWVFLNAWRYRRGGKMLIAPVFSSDVLPENDRDATQFLETRSDNMMAELAARAANVAQPVAG